VDQRELLLFAALIKCKGWKKWFTLFSVQVEAETGNARTFFLILIGILFAMFSTSTGTDIKDLRARFS
jgi:hypothetical protein